MPARVRDQLFRSCVRLARSVYEIEERLARAFLDDVGRCAHFLCDGFLIEHEPLPDFGRIAFKRQGEAASWLAGHRVDMMAARADTAKTMAVDTAVAKG
ncbi:MAG: hypothetical protein E6J74_30315 [Deltaproteobacteria bacterium]|nr:MAG: hypothetical protein E6J74_30315 [Deltaproteobacteria bacterium]